MFIQLLFTSAILNIYFFFKITALVLPHFYCFLGSIPQIGLIESLYLVLIKHVSKWALELYRLYGIVLATPVT